MLQNAILLTCIEQYSVLKTNFGLLFVWPLKTGFIVFSKVKLVVLPATNPAPSFNKINTVLYRRRTCFL